MMKTNLYVSVIGFLLISITLVLGSHKGAKTDSFVVIINPENQVVSMSKADISAKFLKKKTRWKEEGFTGPVEPVDLDSNSTVREDFSHAIHGRSTSAIKNYWQRMIFSGRGVPPPELATDEEVIGFVKSKKGGIGYVSSDADLNRVKELVIED